MPVVAVVNRKGGSGKSTLATHLAAYFAHKQLPALLGDADGELRGIYHKVLLPNYETFDEARNWDLLWVSPKAGKRENRDRGEAERGTVQGSGRGRPSRLYTSAELLGLTGSNPLRA